MLSPKNIYSQVDEHGYRQQTLDCIMEHSKDNKAVPKSDKYITTKSGSRRLRKSTVGWKFLVRWKDASEQWIPLKKWSIIQCKLLNMLYPVDPNITP